MDDVKNSIKSYILDEFLPGENPELLTDATPLVTGGILDSLATLKLVAFLEERFGIEIQPHEMGADNMDNLLALVKLVETKQ